MRSPDEPGATSTPTVPPGLAAGAPHLVLESEDLRSSGGAAVFWLDRTLATIGSHPSCDVVLPDLEPLHAVVFKNDRDEFVFDSCGPETRVHGEIIVESAVLRTGDRIDLGRHSLAYSREEHAGR